MLYIQFRFTDINLLSSEAIKYLAFGGQITCGDIVYANPAVQGVAAVANAVNAYSTKCPTDRKCSSSSTANSAAAERWSQYGERDWNKFRDACCTVGSI